MYEAKAMLEIEHPSPAIVTVQQLFQLENMDSDYLDTQYKILQSDSLAREVIRELHLDQRKEFNRPKNEKGVTAIFRWRDKRAETFSTDAAHEQHVLDEFEDRLVVEPIQRSRLVRVIFDSEDPKLAASVVNTIAQSYMEQEIQMHLNSARKASVWLDGQLHDAKLKLEKSENAVQDYATRNDLLYLQSADGETENITDQRLRELQGELSQAQADRYQKEANFRLAETGDYGALPEVFDNKVTQDLTDKLADLEQQQAALAPAFKPDYPKMKELESQIQRIETFLERQQAEAERHIADEYFAAIHREDLVNEAFQREQKSARAIAAKSVQYNILKREADTNKELYDAFLQHLKEAGVSAALSESNIRVVDAAVPPMNPVKPKIALDLTLGLLLGLASGAGLALVRERIDDTLRSPDELEQSLRIAVLGMIPFEEMGGKRNGLGRRLGGAVRRSGAAEIRAQAEHSRKWPRIGGVSREEWEFREAFGTLRTSVLLTGAGRPPRSIAFTSTDSGEGKTTVCCNLAMSLANLGKRILVIDADIRQSEVQDFFGLTGSAGLINYLAGQGEWRRFVQMTTVKGLDCLVCGPDAPNPSELLSSEKMETLIRDAMNDYNFVLVDSPPLLDLADGRIVARVVEGTILVVRGGATSRERVQRAQACAGNAGARVIGAVLNAMDLRNAAYGALQERARREGGDMRAQASA